MQTVRATITFPYDLHEELRAEAFRQRKSLSRILVEKVRPMKKKMFTTVREDRDGNMERGLRDFQGSLSLTPIGRKLDLDEIIERAEKKEAKRLVDEN
ncbi:hypothetical protein HYU91_00665 [Candidatus Collierbacteria bacterium]|nr:hypothetical protein [Candidatus Collierbacteria bacterium]